MFRCLAAMASSLVAVLLQSTDYIPFVERLHEKRKKNTHKVALVHAVQNEVLCVKGGADLTVLMDGLFLVPFRWQATLRCASMQKELFRFTKPTAQMPMTLHVMQVLDRFSPQYVAAWLLYVHALDSERNFMVSGASLASAGAIARAHPTMTSGRSVSSTERSTNRLSCGKHCADTSIEPSCSLT